MRQINLFILAISVLFIIPSCSKDDPIPEVDQEEVGTAKLVFTEVTREDHGDHSHYHDINNPKKEEAVFSGDKMLPKEGTHLHLDVGKSYRVELFATDFAGRETRQTFLERHDIHQAFILKNPTETLNEVMHYDYGDMDAENKPLNVGVTGYITILEKTNTFVLRYVLRHLNPGVKQNITVADWSNPEFTKFTGANDLDLKVEVHLVDGSNDNHH